MLPPFISDAKDNHPTFIFCVIRSRMLPPFIADAKDKHPTLYVTLVTHFTSAIRPNELRLVKLMTRAIFKCF